MTTALLQFAGAAYALVLPGVLLAGLLDAGWSLPLRVAVGTMLGVLTVPMLSFCAAWLLATSVTPPLVLVLASVLNAALGLPVALRLRRSRRTRKA